jgi:asparagine synthase (glutamine-hydrolysing)
MCGFLGVFGRKADTQWVVANVDNLRDRGPDHQSVQKVNKNFSVGAARLAMVDPLPRSNQPFSDGRFWLCFNGEIYNHEELRKELSEEYSFKTASDTEVLFALLSRFGISALTKLNGMYSFAFFDSRESKLLLGRDSLGKNLFIIVRLLMIFTFHRREKRFPFLTPRTFERTEAIFHFFIIFI